MKISPELYRELQQALCSSSPIWKGSNMRQRWDALHASGFDIVGKLYGAGLNDDHIDTALRRIAHDQK